MTDDYAQIPPEMTAARAIASAGGALAALPDVEPDLEAGNTGDADAEVVSGSEPVEIPDTATLLDDVEETFRRFCRFPDDHAYKVVALWVLHTHVLPAFYSTPRLLFFSSQWGSGKTRALEVLECLAAQATSPSSRPSAALVRRLLGGRGDPEAAGGQRRPTFLLDEVDGIWVGRKEDERDLLTILNVGYLASGTTPILVPAGKSDWQVENLKVFAAVAMAGIDNTALPDTLQSRSIMIRLSRRLSHETVEDFSAHWTPRELQPLRARLYAWGEARMASLTMMSPADVPDVPESVRDRARDVWVPLLKIAEDAGPDWQWHAFEACRLMNDNEPDEDDSDRIRLVADVLRVIKATGEDRINARVLRERLVLLEGSGWGEADYGRPIKPRWLTAELKACGIKKQDMRFGASTSKGYYLADVEAWWVRHGSQQAPELDVGDVEVGTNFSYLLAKQHEGGK